MRAGWYNAYSNREWGGVGVRFGAGHPTHRSAEQAGRWLKAQLGLTVLYRIRVTPKADRP